MSCAKVVSRCRVLLRSMLLAGLFINTVKAQPRQVGATPPGALVQANQQTTSSLRDMGSIAPGVGWVLEGNRVFMTLNNGGQWSAITPPKTTNETIDQVYFSDSNHGWVLMTRKSLIDKDEVPSLVIARTVDGGTTWLQSPVTPNDPQVGQLFSGQANFVFIDNNTGWLTLSFYSGSSFSSGTILSTTDRGATWTRGRIPELVLLNFCRRQ